jgi:hypothetical protein
VLDLAQPKFDVLGVVLRGVGTGLLDHLRGHVDADDLSVGADCLPSEKAVEAAARTQIEHGFAGGQASDRRGIATPESQIGLAVDALDVAVVVTDCLRSVRSLTATATVGRGVGVAFTNYLSGFVVAHSSPPRISSSAANSVRASSVSP